ncbi:DMT family transporter [Mollicutes bacterium LVI A0039]|nr:DMT family transporter [Mollicutes bacterium LVI A0039]
MNKYKIALFACAFVWGFGYVAMDHLVTTSNPLMAISLRFITASVLVYIYKYKDIKGKISTNIGPILVLGFTLLLAFVFQTFGLALTTTSKNAFLTATNVIWTPIIVSLVYKYKVSRNIKIGSIIMIVGVGLVSLDGISGFNLGDVLTLVGAFFFACHIIFINRFARADNLEALVFGQLFITGVFAFILTAMFGQVHIELGMEFTISLLFAAVFSTAICFFLQNYGISKIDSSSAAIILSLEAMFGVVASVVIDNEPLNFISMVGFVVMFSAILIAERKEQ